MAKQTFTTGQVLTAAQMTSLQQTAMLGGSQSVKTTNYVLVSGDAGTQIAMNATSTTTVTVNTAIFSTGDIVTIVNQNTGAAVITAGTATVNKSTNASLTLSQYQGGVLDFVSPSSAIYFPFDVGSAAGGGAKSYTLLNGPSGTAMTGATTITVTIASGYDNLLIMLMDTSSANADSYFSWRFNGDSGAGQYLYAGGAFKAPSTYSASISDKHESGTGGQTSIESIQTASNAGSHGSVGMNIFGANSTGFKAFQLSGNANTGGGNDQQGVAVSGIYKGSAAITSVSVISSTGNFDAGTIYIYGAV